MTYEEILESMLTEVPSDVDTREGSIVYTAIAPCALKLAELWAAKEADYNNSYADTATGEPLRKRTREKGIDRKAATAAVRKAVCDAEVSIGSRFGISGVTYAVTEIIDSAAGVYNYKLTCEQTGTIGNKYSGELLPLQYMEGLGSATLTDVLISGTDIETDDSLRERYFESLESEAFGGNRQDYKKKVKELNGVGGLKSYRAWAGGGTVKLVIITSDFKKPSGVLISTVQEAVDPIGFAGEGYGLAPIDHVVTIAGVNETIVNISTTITYQAGWSWVDLELYAEAAIDEYFTELASTWEDNSNLIVRISKIEMQFLNLTGVVDITGTTINGAESNLVLDADYIPVRGELVG